MQRGQATIEYVGLVVLALIAACLLVRFATPAERIAVDIAHAVAARHRRPPVHHHVRRSPSHRPRRIIHPCRCPFDQPSAQPATTQFSPPADD